MVLFIHDVYSYCMQYGVITYLATTICRFEQSSNHSILGTAEANDRSFLSFQGKATGFQDHFQNLQDLFDFLQKYSHMTDILKHAEIPYSLWHQILKRG